MFNFFPPYICLIIYVIIEFIYVNLILLCVYCYFIFKLDGFQLTLKDEHKSQFVLAF